MSTRLPWATVFLWGTWCLSTLISPDNCMGPSALSTRLPWATAFLWGTWCLSTLIPPDNCMGPYVYEAALGDCIPLGYMVPVYVDPPLTIGWVPMSTRLPWATVFLWGTWCLSTLIFPDNCMGPSALSTRLPWATAFLWGTWCLSTLIPP